MTASLWPSSSSAGVASASGDLPPAGDQSLNFGGARQESDLFDGRGMKPVFRIEPHRCKDLPPNRRSYWRPRRERSALDNGGQSPCLHAEVSGRPNYGSSLRRCERPRTGTDRFRSFLGETRATRSGRTRRTRRTTRSRTTTRTARTVSTRRTNKFRSAM
jgi:hypothetical protein